MNYQLRHFCISITCWGLRTFLSPLCFWFFFLGGVVGGGNHSSPNIRLGFIAQNASQRHQSWVRAPRCKLCRAAAANAGPAGAAPPWSSSFRRLYSAVRRCSLHLPDWMETRVISRSLGPKSVSYRNVSSKADRHSSLGLAHWGSLYYMYTRQHMVHLSDGANSAACTRGGKLD